MTRNPRFFRFALALAFVGTVLCGALWALSFFVGVIWFTPRQGPAPSQWKYWRTFSLPDVDWDQYAPATVHVLRPRALLLNGEAIREKTEIPSMHFNESPPNLWLPSRNLILPRRIEDSYLLVPLWLPFAVLLAVVIGLHVYSPRRRFVRRNSVIVPRRRPSPLLRWTFAVLAVTECYIVIPRFIEWFFSRGLGVNTVELWALEPLMQFFVGAVWIGVPAGAAVYTLRHLLLRRARVDRPECIHCRYNLTANESGTCPECGNPIHPRQAAWLSATVVQRGTA